MSETKNCIACGTEIPAQATVCVACRGYQSAWKNQLQFLGTLLGVLSLVVSAIVFTISTAPEVWKILTWQDEVRVLSYASNKTISVANTGDGDVVVSHILIHGEKPDGRPFSSIDRINRYLGPGDTANIERDEEEFAHLRGFFTISNPPLGEEGYKTHEEKVELINQAASVRAEEQCVVWVFATPEDPGYSSFQSYYEVLGREMVIYDQVKAEIHFYSIHDQETLVQPLDIIAYLISYRRPPCPTE